jgi:lysophospholipase L1-like esterase
MKHGVSVVAAAAVFAGAFGAVAGAYRIKSHLPHSHIESRGIAVLSQSAQGDFPVVVLGDSIVELSDTPTMCGARALNAGLSGARVAQVGDLAVKLLPAERPKLVVIAVGVNDANAAEPTDLDAFRASYRTIVQTAQAVGAHVVALNIEPVGSAKYANSALFDRDRIIAENRIIREMGVPVLDLAQGMAPRDRAVLPDDETDDGVHPNAKGYIAWHRVASQACGTVRGMVTGA